MQIINSNINDVKYRGTGCDALYHGANLIWRRGIVVEPPIEEGVILVKGRFTNDSTEDDWWIYVDGKYEGSNKISSLTKVNISGNVNSITKEFTYSFDDNYSVAGLFSGNNNLKEINALTITKDITDLCFLFFQCRNLDRIDNINSWQTENVYYMNFLFASCDNIEVLDLSKWNTEQVLDMNNMFAGMKKLRELKLNFYIGENTNITDMFCKWREDGTYQYYPNLTTIKSDGGLKICQNFNLSDCHNLTNDSVMVIINALEDRSRKSTATLKLYFEQYETLTDEQKKIATDKNWTIAST